MTPQQRRRQKRIHHILDTALVIVGRDGLEGLTIARLADALDLTPGALYRYFPSKDAILLGMQRVAVDAFSETFAAAVSYGGALADARALPDRPAALLPLLALARAYRALSLARPIHFGLIASSMADPRVLVGGPAEESILGPFVKLILVTGQAMGSAQEAHALSAGDVNDRAICLLSALLGTLILNKVTRLDPELLDTERLARVTLHSMLMGYGAAPDDLKIAEEAITSALDGKDLLAALGSGQ